MYTLSAAQTIRSTAAGRKKKKREFEYTRSRRPVQLIYTEEYLEKHEALSREWHLKHMSRAEKLRLAETARADRKPGTE